MAQVKETFCEAERRRLDKIEKFLVLPNYFKKVGLAAAVLCFIFLLANKFFGWEAETLRQMGKKLLLLSLLIITISREEIEDEMITKIRGQAFSVSFIFGVVYALVQPYVDYFVANLFNPGEAVYSDMSIFQLLFFMLLIYLMFFQTFKKAS